ncbi:hypothetical protein CTEN210_01895 [Chaetoceros tenuissimus]|uniref:PH domain-containing protein n=1 Tax=Chaetoceros tenuissimus TaxID=426638 RepID=A0AAD3CIU1_9STRA|nr:hypothetical protein CTEN210_01895 [Chaetoceros tenuissimus]
MMENPKSTQEKYEVDSIPALADISDCDDTSSACSKDTTLDPYSLKATASKFSTVSISKDQTTRTTFSSSFSRACAGLFCISELLPWEENEKKQKATSNVSETSHSFQNASEEQRKMAQTSIQSEILDLLSCNYLQESDDFEKHFPFLCGQKRAQTASDHVVIPPEEQLRRVKNRNVFMREKARQRIQLLRESGLSRNFSLCKVADMLEEDARDYMNPTAKEKANSDSAAKRRHNLMVGISKSASWSYERNPLEDKDFHRNTDQPRALIQSCMPDATNTTIIQALPSFDSVESDIELFYDSDPGQDQSYKKSGADKIYTIDESKPSKEMDDYNAQRILSVDPDSFDVEDTAKVSGTILELVNASFTFIYHPNKKLYSKSRNKSSHPIICRCWFEMGSCLRKVLVQPNFSWRPLSPKTSSCRQDRINLIQAPMFVDLLNIVRLTEPTVLDRSQFPFAKIENCFMITTNSKEKFLFEAKNREEKRKFLFSTKIMIARLASKIIVGEKDVFDEFFTPLSSSRRSQLLEKETKTSDSASVVRTCHALVAPMSHESKRRNELWGK